MAWAFRKRAISDAVRFLVSGTLASLVTSEKGGVTLEVSLFQTPSANPFENGPTDRATLSVQRRFWRFRENERLDWLTRQRIAESGCGQSRVSNKAIHFG